MISEKMYNSEKQVLTTKDGKEMKKYKFEVGDEFIPQIANVITRDTEALINGKKKIITNSTLPVKAKDKNGNLINNGETIFVTLTPAQANSIKNLIEKKQKEITQELFHAYEYKDDKKNSYIGIGIKKDFKEPKSFADFK